MTKRLSILWRLSACSVGAAVVDVVSVVQKEPMSSDFGGGPWIPVQPYEVFCLGGETFIVGQFASLSVDLHLIYEKG